MLARNVVIEDAGCDAAVVIICIKPRLSCNIKLSNILLYVQLTHGHNFFTCAPSPRRSMSTSSQAGMRSETLKYCT